MGDTIGLLIQLEAVMKFGTIRLILSTAFFLSLLTTQAKAEWPFGLFGGSGLGCDSPSCDSLTQAVECCINPSCELKNCDGACLQDTYGRQSGLGCSLDPGGCDSVQIELGCSTTTACDASDCDSVGCDSSDCGLSELGVCSSCSCEPCSCKAQLSSSKAPLSFSKAPLGCDSTNACDSIPPSCDSIPRSCDSFLGSELDSSCDSIGSGTCGPRHYCTLFGGFSQLNDYRGNAGATQLQGTFSDGWMIGSAYGQYLKSGFRAELEFAFRSNTADTWSVNGASDDWYGHVFSYSGMANLYYDFPKINVAGLKPYVGGGLGLSIIDGDFETNMTNIEIEDESFAYQFMAGFNIPINANVAAFSEYRFFGVSDFDLVNTGVTPTVDLMGDDIDSDNVIFGLRWSH